MLIRKSGRRVVDLKKQKVDTVTFHIPLGVKFIRDGEEAVPNSVPVHDTPIRVGVDMGNSDSTAVDIRRANTGRQHHTDSTET